MHLTLKQYLKDCSIKDLELALQEKKNDLNEKPQIKDNIDLKNLITLLEAHVGALKHGERTKDDKHYIYEEAMQTFYGENIWEWINSTRELN